MRLFRRHDEQGRPYGSWYTQWYDADGVRHEKSTRALDKKAAEDIARQWERDGADPDYATARAASLSDALDLLLRDRASQALVGRRSEDTVIFYRKKAGHLVRIFEQPEADAVRVPFLLKGLRPRHADEYIDQRRTEGAGESTIHKELTTLRAALKLAKRRDLWKGDIAAIIPPGFSPEYKPKERNLSHEEVQRLLPELPAARAAVVAFILATGAEWRAVERARRSDVTPDETLVLLRGTKRETRLRTVPVVTDDQKLLLRYALQFAEGDGELLFLLWNNNVRRDLHEACRRAGIPPCSPTDLRRTFAHWMRALGMPLELIAPMMGHADTRMVERVYGRLSPEILFSRAKAVLDSSDSPADRVDSSALAGLPGLPRFAKPPENSQESVPRDGVEPPTRGFSVPCSTN